MTREEADPSFPGGLADRRVLAAIRRVGEGLVARGLITASGLALGQALTPMPALAQSFGETIDVRVVNVDVYVTDRKGRPVEGLTRRDFVLFENGVEVEVTHFHAGVAGSEVDDLDRAEPVDTSIAAESAPVVAPDPKLQMLVAVYFDSHNLRPGDRARVIDDLERFAASRVGTDLRFLVASYQGGIRIHGGLLSDPAAVARAIDSLDDSSMGEANQTDYLAALRQVELFLDRICGYSELFLGSPRTPDTSLFLSLGGDDPCLCAWGDMIGAWRGYATSVETRANAAAAGVGELISGLGGIPGRKALFYVASGLQQIPGLTVLDYIGELCPHLAQNLVQHVYEYSTDEVLEDLAARANANRVTFYPLDAGGARAEETTGVEFANTGFRPSAGASVTRRANLQAGLRKLAEDTGGMAILNANQPFPELSRVTRDFRSYYSLGFTPVREPDGKQHELRLELRPRRRGVDLRYRRSYRDKTESERLGDRLMAALRLGVEDNPLGVVASLGLAVEVETGVFEVPVGLRLGGADEEREDGSARVGPLRLILAAEDERGRRTALKEKWIEPESAGDDLPQEVVVGMRLRRGPHRIGVAVHDETGLRSSFLVLAWDGSAIPEVAESEDP